MLVTTASAEELSRLQEEFGDFKSSYVNVEINGKEALLSCVESGDEQITWDNQYASVTLLLHDGSFRLHAVDYEGDAWNVVFNGIE